MGARWTADEDRYLAETRMLPGSAVAEQLGRPLRAVWQRRLTLGLGSLRPEWRRVWTEEDDRSIRETLHLTASAAAERLGRTEGAVAQRRIYLSLKSERPLVSGKRTCEQCDVEFKSANRANRPNRFCSKTCRGKASRELMRAIRSRTCRHCGKQFVVSDTAVPGRWCSKTCQSKDEPRRDPLAKRNIPKPIVIRNCAGCGAEISKNLYCSKECYPRSIYEKKRKPLVNVRCNECNTEFLGHDNRLFCSAKCRARHSRRTHGRKHRERARKAGVFYEPINVTTVFDRDGWRCQICGVKTPKRLRGKNEDMSPELDHRIPFALGGDHTYENVQCACRACNLKKSGDQIVGQLSLFPDMRSPTRKARRHRIDGETLVG